MLRLRNLCRVYSTGKQGVPRQEGKQNQAPKEDERPGPTKEEAPHKKVPSPESGQDRPEGIYDQPTKPQATPLRKPGETSPEPIPGVSGVFQEDSAFSHKNVVDGMESRPMGKGLNTFSYSHNDMEVERARAKEQESRMPRDFKNPPETPTPHFDPSLGHQSPGEPIVNVSKKT